MVAPDYTEALASGLRRSADATESMTEELRQRPTKGQVQEAVDAAASATRRTLIGAGVVVLVLLLAGGWYVRSSIQEQRREGEARDATLARIETLAVDVSKSLQILEDATGPCAQAKAAAGLIAALDKIDDDNRVLHGQQADGPPEVPPLPEGCGGP